MTRVALQVRVVRAAAADADLLAVQPARVGDRRVVLVHGDRGGRVVVGRREVEHLGPLGRDRHRADRDVPAAVPVARDDRLPGRRLPCDLDAHPLGDLGRDVDVEALVLRPCPCSARTAAGRPGRSTPSACPCPRSQRAGRCCCRHHRTLAAVTTSARASAAIAASRALDMFEPPSSRGHAAPGGIAACIECPRCVSARLPGSAGIAL